LGTACSEPTSPRSRHAPAAPAQTNPAPHALRPAGYRADSNKSARRHASARPARSATPHEPARPPHLSCSGCSCLTVRLPAAGRLAAPRGGPEADGRAGRSSRPPCGWAGRRALWRCRVRAHLSQEQRRGRDRAHCRQGGGRHVGRRFAGRQQGGGRARWRRRQDRPQVSPPPSY